jgi:hypothetical protein
MKEHPNRQPGRAIAMHRRDDDDGDTDQDFESNWIDVDASFANRAKSRSRGEFIQS